MTRTLRIAPLFLALTALLPVAQAQAPAESSAAAATAIADSTSAILQGDSHRAIAALEKAPAAQFQGKDATYRSCMIGRFERATPEFDLAGVDDAYVRDVYRIYQDYWWQSLERPQQRDALESSLYTALRAKLGDVATSATDMDTLEPLLQAQLLQRGYHAQLGRTMPLRDLMMWRKQDTRYYDVALPEGNHRARVELLDDFASRGWASYARCGRGSAAGWATADALYAVVPAYTDGLDSEAFRVVFLGHETQHFADQNAFPGILPWELEYRAKLVELVEAREVSAKRLGYMMTAQGDDTASPHTYANKRVANDLAARLGEAPDKVGIERLQQASRELLVEDTARRKTAKPAAVAK